ncbi:MAG: TIGR04222 domain-containing membrane protein, partial [Nitrospirae bacterium]|nr:TIGR04222 domain-containing membrane protein [Nitrospirota bacterium]
MNPFDLPGPDFLVFYFFLAGIVIAGVLGARCLREGGDAPRIDSSDPYMIAYLRGGHREAARVAALSLVDRGLLKVKGEDIVTADPSGEALVRRPIEKAVLAWFKVPKEGSSVGDSLEAEAVCAKYRVELERLGLLPDEETKRTRFRLNAGAVLILAGVALTKIAIALARGRTNVEFLAML